MAYINNTNNTLNMVEGGNNMLPIIFFDMDGTIVDLYGVRDVFHRLDTGDASPYAEANPIPNMVEELHKYKAAGHRVVIITALGRHPQDATYDTEQMDKETIINKKEWLSKNGITVDGFHAVPYGTNKYEVAIREYGYEGANGTIVDDDDRVLATWNGPKIKAIPANKMIK